MLDVTISNEDWIQNNTTLCAANGEFMQYAHFMVDAEYLGYLDALVMYRNETLISD